MRIIKDPQARLDYAVDWSPWLGADTIASVVWTVPMPLALESQSHTDTIATVWLSGGTAGQSYAVVCAVTTDAGRVDERTLTVIAQER